MVRKDDSPEHVKPIVKVGYHTAMRQGEILSLTWGQVDLKRGFIKPAPWDCKTNEGRQIGAIKTAFKSACKRAGIEGFCFHDLRHTAINNWRLAGHDYFKIMAATGHKAMIVFKRYNTVSRDELRALVQEKI
jgi:integrase